MYMCMPSFLTVVNVPITREMFASEDLDSKVEAVRAISMLLQVCSVGENCVRINSRLFAPSVCVCILNWWIYFWS